VPADGFQCHLINELWMDDADEMMRQKRRNLARQKRKTGINIGGEA